MVSTGDLKDYLLACMSQVQEHQKEIGRLSVSLAAVVETLKSQNPAFGPSYESNLEVVKDDPAHAETERVIQRIQRSIDSLEGIA